MINKRQTSAQAAEKIRSNVRLLNEKTITVDQFQILNRATWAEIEERSQRFKDLVLEKLATLRGAQ